MRISHRRRYGAPWAGRPHRAVLAAFGFLAAAGACTPPAPDDALANETAFAEPDETVWYAYDCPGDVRFGVRFRADSAVITLAARTVTLPRVESAAGARYVGDGIAFERSGDDISLQVGGDRRGGCAESTASDPWEHARQVGIEFRAIGQEPGWIVEADRGRWLRYVGDYGEVRFLAPDPDAVVSDSATNEVTWSTRTDEHELVLVIRAQTCSDVMSGEESSHTVSLRIDDRELHGCGRTLETGDPAGVHWRLVELDGTPVTGPFLREPHIRLSPEDGQVTGATGCNSLGGPFTMAGDTLRFGALVTTHMACVDAAVSEQEQRLLRALEAADRFEAESDRLTLYAGEREVAWFEARYLL